MQPTEIINANAALEAPARWDAEKHGECLTLPVRVGDEVIQSAWLPSLEELAFINAGGHIVLTVFGYRMTPVSLHVEMETPKAEATRTELAPLDPEQALRQILALITPVNPEPGSLAYKVGQLAVCALEGHIPAPTTPRTVEEIAHTIAHIMLGQSSYLNDGANPLVPVRAVAAAIARGDLCDQPISSPK